MRCGTYLTANMKKVTNQGAPFTRKSSPSSKSCETSYFELETSEIKSHQPFFTRSTRSEKLKALNESFGVINARLSWLNGPANYPCSASGQAVNPTVSKPLNHPASQSPGQPNKLTQQLSDSILAESCARPTPLQREAL